jgi:hypothetical protein
VHKIRIKPSPRPIQTYQHSFILNSYCTFDHNTPPGGVRHLRRKVEGNDHRYTPAGVGLNNTTGIIFNIFWENTNLDPFASRFHKKKLTPSQIPSRVEKNEICQNFKFVCGQLGHTK